MYILEENKETKQYDIYMVNKRGNKTYDCSFNIKEKAELYAKSMNYNIKVKSCIKNIKQKKGCKVKSKMK